MTQVIFEQEYRIYYEDTDAGGVVYHANYLKFAERARTEWLRALGFDQSTLHEEEGVVFVVGRAEVTYHRPARLDDRIIVKTSLQELKNVRMTLSQDVWREDVKLATITIEIVCVGREFRAVRLPAHIAAALEKNVIGPGAG